MRLSIVLLSTLALSTSLLGCVAPSGASDGDGDVASTSEAMTDVTDCAEYGQENAYTTLSQSQTRDTYTRTGHTINVTCGEDPATSWTTVDFDVSYGGSAMFLAEVPSWTLTNGQTECENSTFDAMFFKLVGTQWQQMGGTEVHPTWSNGACSVVGYAAPPTLPGAATYRMMARATRGLAEYNHGYETVEIIGQL